MKKITNEMIEKSYEVGKEFYEKQITLKDGIKILTDIGMNQNSANDYIYNYSNLIQGKLFTRTTSIYNTEYSLKRIYKEKGKTGLQNALLSLSQQIDYYEQKTGVYFKKKKEIYNKYLKLVDNISNQTVYPNEVDPNVEYSEGKVNKVLVNSYERNPIARQMCIDYFGLTCQVCGFDFKKTFGDLGEGFIHVHHKVDIATIGNKYSVNPKKDLIPVCLNCHAMLHKRKPAFSVEELKQTIEEIKSKNL